MRKIVNRLKQVVKVVDPVSGQPEKHRCQPNSIRLKVVATNSEEKDPRVGTGKKPKGSGRRLYTDENPKDTVSIKFATPADARATIAKVKRIKNLTLERFRS